MGISIKNYLVISVSILFLSIVLILGYTEYTYISSSIHENFTESLKKRTEISEQFFLEKDQLNADQQEILKETFIQRLPEESEFVFSVNANLEDTLLMHFDWPKPLIKKIINKPEAAFQANDHLAYAKRYSLNQQEYLVIVLAKNIEGEEMLNTLRKGIFISSGLGVLIIILLVNLLVNRIVQPIRNLEKEMGRISGNNLTKVELKTEAYSEINSLKNSFNNLIEKLQKAFKVQKQFVANASHELRNPMASILGNAEVVLSKERSTQEYKEALEGALIDMERLNKLVNGLLKITKLGNKISRINLSLERVDEILFDVMNNFPESKMVQFNVTELPEDSSELEIKLDKNLIEIAIINLLENALKFSNYQKVQMELNVDRKAIIIQIKDQGIGIEPENIDKIFETFYRSHQARNYEGFGIGLPLTKTIVELHNGEIDVHSEQGKGATFTILLPKL